MVGRGSPKGEKVTGTAVSVNEAGQVVHVSYAGEGEVTEITVDDTVPAVDPDEALAEVIEAGFAEQRQRNTMATGEYKPKVKNPLAFEMPMPYMLQMGAMMNLGNLYNCSPGRHPHQSAAIAHEAALALCAEMEKRKDRYAKLIEPGDTFYPMPIGYMLKMSSMMNMANLYNASQGRNHEAMAKAAIDGAEALCLEYIKRKR